MEGQRTKKGSRWRERRVGCIPCVSSLSECAYNTKSKESQRFGLKIMGGLQVPHQMILKIIQKGNTFE